MANELTEARLREIEARRRTHYFGEEPIDSWNHAMSDVDSLIAALRQARQERDEAQAWKTEQQRFLMDAARVLLEASYTGDDVLGGIQWLKADRDAARADLAALTALPPLPEGWVSNGDVDTYGWQEYIGPDCYLVHVDACGVHVYHERIGDVVVADLVTVLRHAEREHQRLREERAR